MGLGSLSFPKTGLIFAHQRTSVNTWLICAYENGNTVAHLPHSTDPCRHCRLDRQTATADSAKLGYRPGGTSVSSKSPKIRHSTVGSHVATLPEMIRAFLARSLLLLLLLLLHYQCRCMEDLGAVASVFEQGCHAVSLSRVAEAARGRCSSPPASGKDRGLPPKPLLVAAPREAGDYPVLLFLHGYLAANSFYSQLLEHVASHGFVVVGPQLYTVSGPNTTDEINAAAAVIAWLANGGLSSPTLPPGVRADTTKLSIAGHSRGGKVAFALALGHARSPLPSPLAAIIGVDPVDGMGVGQQTPPPILTGRNASLRVPAPVLVLGTGLGELPGGPLLPPCAPRGVSHAAFYDECAGAAPHACHLVARDYGHTDMMDDATPGARGALTRVLCRSGGARAPMRRFVAGATVAFLRKWAGSDGRAMDRIPEKAPVVLSVVEFADEK